MNTTKLIEIADTKEKQALAFTSIFMDKLPNEELQIAIDSYCDNMASTYVSEYKKFLVDKLINQQLRKHIQDIGADKKHSGKRFYEALYKRMNNLENEKSNAEKTF